MSAPSSGLPLNWPLVMPPDGVLDFQFDWSQWLNLGDTITASTFTVTSDTSFTGIGPGSVSVASSSFTATTTTVWLSGGVLGYCSVMNHVTTSGGRQMDWTMTLKIEGT